MEASDVAPHQDRHGLSESRRITAKAVALLLKPSHHWPLKQLCLESLPIAEDMRALWAFQDAELRCFGVWLIVEVAESTKPRECSR